jgi:hypothetical protein
MDLLRMVKAILRILRLLVCFEGMYWLSRWDHLYASFVEDSYMG